MLCHATAATLALDLCTEDVSIGCNVVVQVCVLSQQLGTSTYAFSEPRTQLIRTMVSGHIRRVLLFSSMMKRSLHFRIQRSNRRGIIRPIQYSYQVPGIHQEKSWDHGAGGFHSNYSSSRRRCQYTGTGGVQGCILRDAAAVILQVQVLIVRYSPYFTHMVGVFPGPIFVYSSNEYSGCFSDVSSCGFIPVVLGVLDC